MKNSIIFRLYPTCLQQTLIHKTFGCSRLVYNHFLTLKKRKYEEEGIIINNYDCCIGLNTFIQENNFLRDIDHSILENELKKLEENCNIFYETNEYPQFRTKKYDKQIFTTLNKNNNISISNDNIYLPKLGWIKLENKKHPNKKIITATITKNNNKYYAMVLFSKE